MTIHVEQNGILQEVTKQQLIVLAQLGEISPHAKVVINGKETTAGKIKELEFPAGMEYEQDLSPPSLSGASTVVQIFADPYNPSAAKKSLGERLFLDPQFTSFWTVSYLKSFWWWYVLFSYIAFFSGVVFIVFRAEAFLGESFGMYQKVTATILLAIGIFVEIVIVRIVFEIIMVLFRMAELLKNIDSNTPASG